MNPIVFLGPSLPLAEALRILPDADFRPPARQADLASVLAARPTAIALVDGEFHQARSVWHKEILLALEQGIPVFGASSMGALRAAELEAFGMAGIGSVFSAFASGELTDDDEVALIYHAEDGVYTALSEPMVNIRATLAAARERGAVTGLTSDLAVRAAKAMHYPKRTLPAMLAALRAQHVADEELVALEAFWRKSKIDIKADDARTLLHLLRAHVADPPPPRGRRPRVERTAALDTLYDRERWVEIDDRRVALADIAEFTQLHHPDAAGLNAAALNRALALVLAGLLDVEPAPGEVDQEITRWRLRHDRADDDRFAAWLTENHVTEAEFRELAREAAQCRALWRWLLYVRHVERTARPLLDHLRWTDEYREWAVAATALPDTDEVVPIDTPSPEALTAMVADHTTRTGSCVDTDIGTWAEEAGFNSLEHLLFALTKAAQGVRDAETDAEPKEDTRANR